MGRDRADGCVLCRVLGNRNQFGSALGDSVRDASFRNAERIIDIEQAMGLYVEEWIHNTFLPWDWFIVFWNVFYGTFHFAVTIGAMVLLFARHPERYTFMRSTLAATTGVALVGFAFFPLMPPRLLGNCTSVRGVRGRLRLHRHPGRSRRPLVLRVRHHGNHQQPIRRNAEPAHRLGHLVHRGAVPGTAPPLARALIVAYPIATMFAIVVTANHFWLDAVGGVIALGVGLKVAPRLTRLLPGRAATLRGDVARRPQRA